MTENSEYVFPASFAQCGHWFLHQLQPASSFYNVPIALHLTGHIDTEALTRAFDSILERHEVLRTVFRMEDGDPIQIVRDSVHPASRMQVIDLSALSPSESSRRARELVAEGIAAPFNLACGPVIRACLVSVTASDHRLLIVMHHIVTDIPSCDVLTRELASFYGRLYRDVPNNLEPLQLQYGDYAAWQRQEGQFENNLAYWREQLRQPVPVLSLPSDRPRPTIQNFNGASLSVDVPEKVGAALLAFCKYKHVTVFTAALAAYAALLYHRTSQTDLLIGTPVSNRSMKELEPLIGLFLNTVALRIVVRPEEPFSELLARVQKTVVDAFNHEVPFEKLVEELKPERDPSRSPFFQTMLTVQHGRTEPALLPGVEITQISEVTWNTAKFDLTVFIIETDGIITIGAEYNTGLFDPATVETILNQLVSLFQAIAENPDKPLAVLGPSPTSEETIERFIQRLREIGLRLFVDSGRLKVNAPKGVVDETIKAAIAARRTEIVNALSSEVAKDLGGTPKSLQRIARTPPLPLSAVQRRFWFVDRFEQGRGGHNVRVVFRLDGIADLRALTDALEFIVMRHESLRMRIGERDDEPYAEIIPTSQGLVKVVDLTDKPEPEREIEGLRLAREALNANFDLARGPVARFFLIRISLDRHLVVMNMHHIVADGWSLSIAGREFAAQYSALTSDSELNIADLPVQYVDYAAWEGEQIRGGLFDRQIAYWQATLAGAPVLLELPTDRIRPPVQSFKGDQVGRIVDSDLADDIGRYCRRRDVTPFMAILAALHVLFHRISGQDDIVIGTPIANRGTPELENVIGPFVNNLALRVNLAKNPTFNEFLTQVRRVAIDAIDNRDVPFDLVVEAVNPLRTVGHAPIFQVMFALSNFPLTEPSVGELKCTMIETHTLTAQFDLSVDMVMYQNKLVATYEYSTDLFDRATIERMHDNLMRLLREAVNDDTRLVRDLPLLSSNDERVLIGDWNSSEVEHDRHRCVHHLFERIARTTPDARAVIVGGETFTYREVDERANRLAHMLRSRGVAAGDRVAICLDRSADMPVAMTAVLKAGAAYVPLDPTHPSERLRYTLDDAKTACVITQRCFAKLFAETELLLLLDEAEADLDRFQATPPDVAVRPEDLSYIIYTSGSTGRPKGVQVEHRNVVNFLEAMRRKPGLVAADVVLAVTTLAFDIAGLEIWLPFCVGASVVLASREEVLVGERLIALLDQHQVTVMQATPSTWRLMLGAGWIGKPDLKTLCGGEALPRDLAAQLASRVYQLWNMYGPTETTIWSTISLVTDPSVAIPIGRPIANTRVYVLEPSGLMAPIGAFGELAIGGEGVARGYWNRPELTAEKFVTLSLPNGRVERVYRTGDIVRFRNDGQLEFNGRRDHQVKLRGYRIELGEIELVLANHPGVQQCVVAMREDDSDPQLVGYVVQSTGAVFDPDSARSTLRSNLPVYMVPSQFVVLPALPLTPNNKIDRKALPAPEGTIARIAADGAESLMTPVQQRVAEIWRNILRIDRVSLHDNFFDIGGHSMLIVKLHGALKREFDSDLTLIELFQQTTVALQSERVTSAVVSELALHRAQARARKRLHG